jgi:hypothetical protein
MREVKLSGKIEIKRNKVTRNVILNTKKKHVHWLWQQIAINVRKVMKVCYKRSIPTTYFGYSYGRIHGGGLQKIGISKNYKVL